MPRLARPYGWGVRAWVLLSAGAALAAAGVRLGYLSARDAGGGWLGRFLAVVRGNPVRLFAAGVVSAALLHSSSAVEVAVLALAQSGRLGPDEGLWVILGANLGTTATAQLVAFSLPGLGLVLMAAGLALVALRRHPAAPALFGLGCFLQGLEWLGAGLAPWAARRLQELAGPGRPTPARGFVWGWAVTAAIQSSTLVSSTLVALVERGAMDAAPAVAAVLGANVGTVTTGLAASLFMGRGARWLAWVDFGVNLAGAALALVAFPWFFGAVACLGGGGARAVAHAHTLFNVAIVLACAPLVRPLARFARRRP